MAKAKFDIKTIELPPVAARPLYVGVGATDLAVEYVRETVADVQKRLFDVQQNVKGFDFEPKALRAQATTVVNARVDAVTDNVATVTATVTGTVTGTYAELAERGEDLVARIRNQEATKATVASARTTKAKAKTTRTQGTKAAKSTSKATTSSAKSAARKATRTAKKSSGPARSSAKATGTSARKTASKATKAVADGAAKVGS